jgi:hypothetical protein
LTFNDQLKSISPRDMTSMKKAEDVIPCLSVQFYILDYAKFLIASQVQQAEGKVRRVDLLRFLQVNHS